MAGPGPETPTAASGPPSYIEAAPGVIAGPANYIAPVTPSTSRLEDTLIAGTMQDAEAGPVTTPRSVRIVYVGTSTTGGANASVPTTLNWRHDEHHYSLTWDMFSKVAGNWRQANHGLLTPQGLAPVQSVDMRDGSSKGLRFDYANRMLVGNVDEERISFVPGTQDALSVLVQLASMVAGDPTSFTLGTRLVLPVLSGGAVHSYAFTVQPGETLVALQGKSVETIPLVLESTSAQPNMQVWLAPSLDYMPVRWRVMQANGNWLDQLAQNAYELTVPAKDSSPR